VHDPKSSGQSIVKASIKLRVTNTAGHSMVVIRSMELAQQKIKLQFKALDGVIRTTDQATGKRISMSHKCTELDKQLPIFLGVSKPILEHVVFCHQEESSWPLWDSAELKKRFDAIFDSTKYTKALKNIEEIRKDYREKAKELKVECAGLASHKHAAKQYSLELEEQSNGLEDLEESIAEITKSVKHYQEVLQQNQQIMNKAQDIQTDLDTKRTELDRQRAVYQAQCSYVSEDMTQTHSLRQLKDMLRDFDDTVEQRMEERDALEGRKKKLQEDLQDIQNQVATVLSQQGRVAAEQQRYSNLLNQRLEQMQQVAHNHGVELAVTQASQKTSSQRGISQFSSQGTEGDDDELLQISKSDMEAFFQALQDKEESLRNELKQHKERSQAEQDSIQEALADLDARSRVLQQSKSTRVYQVAYFGL
jgi:DNA repair protein RAD50